MSTTLQTCQVFPNPDQPRQNFDEAELRDLATSILENGLLQPITVRALPSFEGFPSYEIVAGERRWRAHVLAGIEAIECNVVTIDEGVRDILAIVENLQRKDITPLEQAKAYQRMLDNGYTPESLAQKLGIKHHWRIGERTALLRLRPDYQYLLSKNQITPSQGFEMARLDPQDQDVLFSLIKTGRAGSYVKLRAAADDLLAARAQAGMFEESKPATKDEVEALTRFERRITQLVGLANSGFQDGEIVALKKINPGRAALVADQLEQIQKHLAKIEREIRRVAVQEEFATA